MATINAAATGNWSATTTWTGGVVPGPSDDVYTNGKTITIDQDISVNSLNVSTTGGYVISSVGVGVTRTLTTATVITVAIGVTLLTISATSGAVVINTPGVTAGPNNGNGVSITGSVPVTLNGSVTGGSATGVGAGVNISSSATVTISGEAKGGTGVGGYGVYISSGATVTIGQATGNAGPGVYLTSAAAGAVLNVQGAVAASASAVGIKSDAVNVIRVKGPLSHGTNNYAPIQAPCWMVYNGQTITWTVKDDSASPNTGASVVLSNALTGTPATADVRNGVHFGGGSSLTGTLKVPPASSVASGVPVDATTGTATLDLGTVTSILGDQIAAALTSG